MRLVSIFILFILMGIGVQAQVSFVVKASKKTLGINERLRIDFEMNEDGDNFVPPSFKRFNVVGGPNQSISNSWINGKRSYSKTYSYFLAPKSQGKFTINQATIEIDNQTTLSKLFGILKGSYFHFNFLLTNFISSSPKGLPWDDALPLLFGDP